MDDLQKKIDDARKRNAIYAPTYWEWHDATPYQRQHMTWPREVIEQIAREGA